MSNWFDDYGLLHLDPGGDSENGVLFAAESHLLNTITPPFHSRGMGDLLRNVYHRDWFDPNPAHMINNAHSHFSHDNLTGVYCLNALLRRQGFGLPWKKLPILHWNNRLWLHPRDICFYSIFRMLNKIYLLPAMLLCLLPIILAAVISCRRDKGITSGKLLVFVRLKTLSICGLGIIEKCADLAFKLCHKILTKIHGPNPYLDISKTYFPNDAHPVREGFRRFYNV